MRPDASVLLLTTLIGAGQGLFLALFTVQAYALFGLLPVQHGHTFYAHGSLVALVLLACGLAASFFHLGRPERAWRSAAQWRTSWLSREVIVLPAFMGALALYAALHAAGRRPIIEPGIAEFMKQNCGIAAGADRRPRLCVRGTAPCR